MGDYGPGSSIHSGSGNGNNREIVLNEMGASDQQHLERGPGMGWDTSSQRLDIITEDHLLNRDVEHQMAHQLLNNKRYSFFLSQL